tara:strand:- start:274 stop:495 length:222 start_codon:yes stop_codon:yes gene_type:complete
MLLTDYIIPPFILNKEIKEKKNIFNTNQFNLKYEEPIHNFVFIKKLHINIHQNDKLNKTIAKKRQKKNKTEKN